MDVWNCIESRVSTRIFKSSSIPDKMLYEIIKAARYAPSPKNRQPWRFAILSGKEKKIAVQHCRRGLKEHPENIASHMDMEFSSESHTFDIMEQAPVVILVFNAFPSEQVLSDYNLRFDYANVQAIGAAIENMLLRATELGLGTLWIGDVLTEEAFLTERYFNQGKLIAGIALGFPGSKIHRTKRLPISQLIVFNGGKK